MLLLLAALAQAPTESQLGVPVYPGAHFEPRRSAVASQGIKRVYVFTTAAPLITVVRFYERRIGDRATSVTQGRYEWPDLGLKVEPDRTPGAAGSVITIATAPPSLNDLEASDSETEGESPEIAPPETPPRPSEVGVPLYPGALYDVRRSRALSNAYVLTYAYTSPDDEPRVIGYYERRLRRRALLLEETGPRTIVVRGTPDQPVLRVAFRTEAGKTLILVMHRMQS
jgi:hypothetical protein